MKPSLPISAILAAVLIASPLFAKAGDTINGVPIGLEGDPGSVVISQTKTNSEGVATFRNVKPGKYRLVIGIDWGDGSTTRKPVSKISENESPLPTAVIGINVPGQAKVVYTVQGSHTYAEEKTKVGTGQLLLVPFTVAGNEVRTFTATVTWGD
jgi:hypothetical protein